MAPLAYAAPAGTLQAAAPLGGANVTLAYAMLLSMMPVSELRGGIPLAVASGAGLWAAFLACTAANVLVIPLVFLFLDHVHGPLMRLGPYAWFMDHYIERLRRKVGADAGALGYAGLCTFVAVPLPATGAYTGCVVAWLLGMRRGPATVAIALGVLIAGVVVTLVVGGTLGALAFLV